MFKQQLHKELENTPTDASQVCSSVNSSLNSREGSGSVVSIKLLCNNLDVNLVQQAGRSVKPLVFVLGTDGNPLMPCTFAKSKRMEKKGVAEVVSLNPFTIRLLSDIGSVTQPVTLGITFKFKNS